MDRSIGLVVNRSRAGPGPVGAGEYAGFRGRRPAARGPLWTAFRNCQCLPVELKSGAPGAVVHKCPGCPQISSAGTVLSAWAGSVETGGPRAGCPQVSGARAGIVRALA